MKMTRITGTSDISTPLQVISMKYRLPEINEILSREELTKIITRRKLIMGLLNGKPVGFVGEHLEGSLGILYILPEYRKQGFAAYLEKYQMNEMLKDGYLPFGQVEVGNEKSLNLQKKLGFKECSGFVYWFF